MLHRRFVVAEATIDGNPMRLRHGSLVIAARAEAHHLDWEAMLQVLDPTPLDQGRYEVAMCCILDATPNGALNAAWLSGPMFVVRQVDDAIVLRGDGPVAGFDIAMLNG